MSPILLATTLALGPMDLVRVDDPDFPGADAVSATGAVLLAPPPPGVPWRWEAVPETTAAPAVEALDAMQVQGWHDAGFTGAGVKVAVFDLQWFGVEADAATLAPFTTHDCYLTPTCEAPMDTWRPRFGFEEGAHGHACAQVIRDIAPDAMLHLVRVNTSTTLENAVDWAIREGVHVVSMSLSFFNTSFYDGTGFVSAQIDKLARAGVLPVVSAGNYASAHWHGPYADTNHDGRMDLDGGDGLWVNLPVGGVRGLFVNWNQHRSCGLTDLDAYLYDAAGNRVGGSEDVQQVGADRCAPVERLSGMVTEAGWHRLEIVHRRGARVALEVDVLATSGRVFEGHPGGSIADPGSAAGAFTVGAVRARGYLTNDVASYSSRGPTSDGREKPDIAGPDGLTTVSYGLEGFFGTSAAAPAVAGLVALVLSEDPSLTPRAAAARLQGWAIGAPRAPWRGDPRWGAGKARLPSEPEPVGCGRRPLLLPLWLPPLFLLRRRVGAR